MALEVPVFGQRASDWPLADTDGPRYRRVDRWYLVVHRGEVDLAARFPGTDHM